MMKRPTEPTHETFLKDVAKHEMFVKKDDADRQMEEECNQAEAEAALITARKEGAASVWDRIAEIGDMVTEKAIRVTAEYAREQAARERGAK